MRAWRAFRAIIALCLGLGLTAPVSATTIRIGGTGGALEVMRVLGESFISQHPNVKVEIVPGLGSGGGRRALKAGALDVVVTGIAGKGIEKTNGLVSHLYGRVPFVIAVQKKNSVANFTSQDLVDIYSGKKIYWPDGERIRCVLRPLSDSDTDMLHSISPELKQILVEAHQRGGMRVGVDDIQAADTIESINGGVGSSVLSLILSEKRSLRAVALNKVAPSVKSIADGSYPFLKSYYISTSTNSSAPSRLFIDFVLSPGRQAILESMGHWVAEAKAAH